MDHALIVSAKSSIEYGVMLLLELLLLLLLLLLILLGSFSFVFVSFEPLDDLRNDSGDGDNDDDDGDDDELSSGVRFNDQVGVFRLTGKILSFLMVFESLFVPDDTSGGVGVEDNSVDIRFCVCVYIYVLILLIFFLFFFFFSFF